jgi:hypothetical protein
MAKSDIKWQAINLRQSGTSISAIAERLAVSKSTVSVWCRNVTLSDDVIEKIASAGNSRATAGLLRYSERKRLNRQLQEKRDFLSGSRSLGKLSKRDIYCIGLGLYWGEGYKRGNQEFGFTNSDPVMIRFYIKWLEVIFDVSKKDLILRVSINEMHKIRLSEVEAFWSKLLRVPKQQFTKSSLIKTKNVKVYENVNEHMGTLRVKVRKGTAMRRRTLGAIQQISKTL